MANGKSTDGIIMDVVIIGNDHYNTYGVVRSLGEEGINSDVILLNSKKKESYVLRSRFVNSGYACFSYDEVISILEGYNGSKGLIICCSDEAEVFVVNHYSVLSKHFVLPVCENPNRTIQLMNKEAIGELAHNYGISIPTTWHVINRQIPEGVEYPCITKPITSTSGHKSDIVVCRNENELRNVVEDEVRCSDYVVQQYIEFEREVSILGVVLTNGEVILSGCIDKLRTCMIGTTSFGVMVDNSILGDNVPKLMDMMKGTGYRGLFSAEFIVKDGVYYFLEVNFRNDGNTYVATASGLNLPFLYVSSFCEQRVLLKEKLNYPCFFMLVIEDLIALRINHVSFSRWRSDLRRANTCLVYNKQDVRPFMKKARNTVVSLIQRVWHKIIGKNT